MTEAATMSPSELRAIEPISIIDLDTDEPETGEPICERVDPKTLFVDPAYQRSFGERGLRQIRRIVEAFDWTKYKPPICTYADHDGQTVLKVIDGQHTAIAAASHPHIDMIPVMIVEAAETAVQAAAFVGQNTQRLGVTPLQVFFAEVTAGAVGPVVQEDLEEAEGDSVMLSPLPTSCLHDPHAYEGIKQEQTRVLLVPTVKFEAIRAG